MKKLIHSWVLLLTTLSLVVSCSHEKNYVNVLPSEASLVVAIDIPSLVEKSGISGEDKMILKEKVEKALKGGLQLDEAALVEKVVENPSESGIGWTDKVYMFTMGGNYATGFLASVESKEKLEALLDVLVEQKVCGSFTNEDGYCLAVSEGKFIVSYNETALLIVGVQNEKDVVEVKGQVDKWMTSSREESYISTAGFEKLQAMEGDIKMDVSMAMLPRQYSAIAVAGLPEGFRLEDVHSLIGLCFEKGELDMNVENFYTNDKLEAQIERMAKLYEGRTNGKFLDKFSSDVIFWVNTCIDGKKLYVYLQENPSTSAQLKNMHLPVDLEKILKSFQGELALGISASSRIPQLGFYAEVSDETFLQEFEPFKPILEAQGFCYGVEDGVFYLTNRKEAEGESLKNVSWADEVEDKLFFSAINMDAVKAIVPLLPVSERMMAEMVTTYIESIQIYASETQCAHFVLKAIDKDTNILEQCIDWVKKTSSN